MLMKVYLSNGLRVLLHGVTAQRSSRSRPRKEFPIYDLDTAFHQHDQLLPVLLRFGGLQLIEKLCVFLGEKK